MGFCVYVFWLFEWVYSIYLFIYLFIYMSKGMIYPIGTVKLLLIFTCMYEGSFRYHNFVRYLKSIRLESWNEQNVPKRPFVWTTWFQSLDPFLKCITYGLLIIISLYNPSLFVKSMKQSFVYYVINSKASFKQIQTLMSEKIANCDHSIIIYTYNML